MGGTIVSGDGAETLPNWATGGPRRSPRLKVEADVPKQSDAVMMVNGEG